MYLPPEIWTIIVSHCDYTTLRNLTYIYASAGEVRRRLRRDKQILNQLYCSYCNIFEPDSKKYIKLLSQKDFLKTWGILHRLKIPPNMPENAAEIFTHSSHMVAFCKLWPELLKKNHMWCTWYVLKPDYGTLTISIDDYYSYEIEQHVGVLKTTPNPHYPFSLHVALNWNNNREKYKQLKQFNTLFTWFVIPTIQKIHKIITI